MPTIKTSGSRLATDHSPSQSQHDFCMPVVVGVHALDLRGHLAGIGHGVGQHGEVAGVIDGGRGSRGVGPASGRHGEALHLAVRRLDESDGISWDDLQWIKNEIAGADRVAVELYPEASEVMDQANMRHPFVLPVGVAAPFTIRGRWA